MKKILHFLSFAVLLMTSNFALGMPHNFKMSTNPREVWDAVNTGWSGVYADLYEQYLDPRKDYIVWSIIAPKKPLDLRKPDFFRDFLAHNSSNGVSISHNLLGWNCSLPNGDRLMGATGMSGERSGQTAKLVKAGYGLTSFLAVHQDGWLSPADMTPAIWDQRSKGEEIYNLVVEVSPKECASMVSFLKKFIFHPKKPFTKFGLTVDPEKFEGGGCITFAAAMLKRAGILNKMLNATERKLWASHYRFGGNDLPLPDDVKVPRISWREGAPKKVRINEFFSSNWNAGLKGVSLNLLDPELMVWGIKSLSPQLASQPRKVQKFPSRDTSCRDNSSRECSWHSVKIDNTYDKQAAKISSLAKSWKRGMIKKGYEMTSTTLRGEPFLIFQK